MGTLVIIISIIIGMVLSAFLIKVAVDHLGGLVTTFILCLLGLAIALTCFIMSTR